MQNKLTFLESIFGKSQYHSGTKEAMFQCPMCHHHKPKLSINLETNSWQCFVCGKNGKKLLYPIKQAGGSKEDLQKYIDNFKAKEKVFKKQQYDFEVDFSLKFPESYVPITNCEKSVLGRKGKVYLQGRGITDLSILRHKIGIVIDGKFENRVLFPSFNSQGRLNFFTTRAYNGHYLNPWVPKGYKNTIILNELNIDWSKPVVIVEGFVDMLKSVLNTVPLFGSSVHYDSLLFEQLVKHNSEVVLALDPDAWEKSEKLAKKLFAYDLNVYNVDIGNFKDVGEMDSEQFLKAYENRYEWNRENSFRRKLRAL